MANKDASQEEISTVACKHPFSQIISEPFQVSINIFIYSPAADGRIVKRRVLLALNCFLAEWITFHSCTNIMPQWLCSELLIKRYYSFAIEIVNSCCKAHLFLFDPRRSVVKGEAITFSMSSTSFSFVALSLQARQHAFNAKWPNPAANKFIGESALSEGAQTLLVCPCVKVIIFMRPSSPQTRPPTHFPSATQTVCSYYNLEVCTGIKSHHWLILDYDTFRIWCKVDLRGLPTLYACAFIR